MPNGVGAALHCSLKAGNNCVRVSTGESAPSASTIAVDNSNFDDSTAFVIRARNRIGFLQVITKVFNDLSLSIDKATVKFEGDFFIKKFFVTDSNGNKIEDSESLERIKRALAEAISVDDGSISAAIGEACGEQRSRGAEQSKGEEELNFLVLSFEELAVKDGSVFGVPAPSCCKCRVCEV